MTQEPSDKYKSLRWKIQAELGKTPQTKGWFVISYTIILISLVITAYFTPNLNLEKDIVIAFSTIVIDVFIILLATFLGGYFALITFIEPKTKKKTNVEELSASGIFATMKILKEIRYSMIIPMLLVIFLSIILIFFYSPLSINPSLKTFIAFTILEISIIAGWVFVRFMIKIAFLIESIIGGNL